MKKYIYLFLFLFAVNLSLAQKTLRLVVYQVDAGTHDCDGFGAGDSDWVISWDGGSIDEQCHGFPESNNPSTANVSYNIFNTTYDCVASWPSGNLSYTLYGDEADFGEGDCSHDYSTGQSWAYPSTSNGNSNLNGGAWISLQVNECNNADFVRYRARWEVSGSFISTPGNNNICSAQNFGTTNQSYNSGWQSFNNDCATLQGSEPSNDDPYNTVWYRFTTPATGLVSATGELEGVSSFDNTVLNLYRSTNGSCSFGNLVFVNGDYDCAGNNDIDISTNCLLPNTTYFWQMGTTDCTLDDGETGNYRFRMYTSTYAAGPDDVCNATTIGNINGLTASLSENNQSNECATTQGGEPSGDQNTVWYYFTTGATVAYDFSINMDAETNGLNSDIYVYEICNNACSGSTPNWGNLTEIDNFFDVNPLPGEFDAGGTISGRIKPNSTYYIRADGTSTVGTTGGFDIDMSFSGGAYASNDNICNAATISTLAPGNNSTTNGTIDKSSSEDHCTLNEPNQDADETTVWYKYNVGATTPSLLSFDVDFGFGCSPDLRIYSGPTSLSSCPFTAGSNGFSQLTYIADGGLDGFYEIECVLPNTTYYLQVDEDGLCSGTFTLEVITGPTPPVNDLPCNAINVTTQPENTYSTTNFSGTNINGTDCFEPDAGWTLSSNNSTVWYKLSAPGRNLIIDANNNSSDNIDIKLALYEGPCGNSAVMTPNYIDRDYDPGSLDEDMYFSCLDPTKDYFLAVDGAGTLLNLDQGNFDIEVYYPYEGGRSTCTGNIYPARSIGTVPNAGSISYLNTSNLCGMNAADLASSGGAAAIPAPPFTVDKAVWYTFRPPSSGSVKINANSDQLIGPALGLGSGDEINLEMVVYESSDGSCQPASWTVTDYASYSNGLVSYNEELIVNCLDPTKDYWLLVDGEFDASLITGGTEGYFDLSIEDYGVTTPNDLACDAIPFTTNTAQLNAWNACNSNHTITLNDQNNYCGNNLNEPTPSNWTPLPGTAKPIWYTFIAPPSGKLEIRLNTTTILPWRQDFLNGKLAVYDLPDGQNICTYQFVDSNEVESDYQLDIPPVTGEDMEVECLIPGRTYYLMVDGKETALYPEWFRGEFSLEFESDPRDAPGPNDFICDAESLGNPTGGSVTTSSLRPRGSLGDPYFCMGAENNFCMTATGDPSLPGFGLWSLDQTAWYTFIAPSTGSIRIDATNVNCGNGSDNIDIQLAVVESSDGTCTGSFNVLESEYDIGSFDETLEVHCLDEGTTYWLLVDGGGILDLVQGCFEVEITEIPATITGPVNDDVCNATPSTPFTAPWSASNQTNSCASIEFGIPEPTAFDRDRTVWYSFTTPNGAGPYAVDVSVNSSLPWPFGDAMDPQLALYESSTGICSGMMIEIASEYNPIPFTENFEFHCLEPSTNYWLMVDGSLLNTQGDFSIDIEQIAANPIAINDDLCSNIDLGTLGASNGDFLGGTATNYNNFCADVEVGEIVPQAYGLDQTVWFSFVTPTLGSPSDGINIDLDVTNDPNGLGDQIDLQFAIFQSSDGTCSGTLTEIESAYNPLGFSEEMKDLCLKQNTRYFVQVDGGINVQGYFSIQATNDGVSAHPVNDDFCNAQSLSLGTITAGNNECATLESGEPNAGLGAQKSVWYSFVAPPSGRVEIRTSDNDGLLSGIDPEWRLYGFTGSCTAGAFTGSFDELANDYTPLLDDVEDYECLFPGTTYYVQVDGTTLVGDEGDFEVTITDLEPDYGTLAGPANATDPEPINNGCDLAIDLTVNSESCQYSTGTWEDENYGKPSRSIADISCGQNCGEIWYKFTMPATGFAKIEGNDDFGLLGVNNSELVIAAYRGTCGSFTLIECGLGGFNQDVDFSISGTPSETIYLQVFDDGGDDINEDFQICVSARCAADDCEDALTVPSILGQGPQCFDVNDATGESIIGGDSGYGVGGVYADDPSNSVYFSFTTDDFCSGYVLTLTTTDVGSIGGLGGVELIMSIYEDDGSLCTHNILGEPLLDIQTFDKSIYPSGVTYTITYEVGTALNNIKTNTTYVIQIEGNSTTVDGTIEVEKLCEGREWAYPTAPATSSNGYCYDGTWRHYYNDNGSPLNPLDDILIFSVKSNGNVFDGTASIILDAAPGFAEDPGVEASWTMRRYWDFDVTSGSIDPAKPVDVKFYYLDAEKQEIITLAQNYATTNSLTYEAFEWFKSQNGVDFDPSIHVTPPIVVAAYGSGAGPTITGDVIVQATGVSTTVLCRDHDADPTNEFCNGVQYVEYVGLTGFSGGTGGTGASNKIGSPLPVELISFEGEKTEAGNKLTWKTATEVNNDFFHLEHSTDGIVFNAIAEIDGAGNSTITNTYREVHEEFVESFNYYRLRNVDFDGSFEISDIVVIDNSVNEQEESIILLLYPNPSSLGQINLDAYIVNAGTYRVDVYDLLGKIVSSKNIDLVHGNNTVKVGFEGLSSGSYIIELVDLATNKRVKKKFIRTDE